MNNDHSKMLRILGVSPSTRGFGFVVLDKPGTLVDWGVKSVKGDKNTQSLVKIKAMIAHYQPGVLVLQDTKHSRRALRIRTLSKRIIALAATRKIKVALFSREQVMQEFFADGQGTKYALAELLAKRFPEELASRLPPKRRPWMSEDSRMDIFAAVALALTSRQRSGSL